MNDLARLIHSRKAELDVTWTELAKRGGFASHSIIYTLATKPVHKNPPREATLVRLAKALDLPLETVRQAAIKACGYEVKEVQVGLEDMETVRVLVAYVGEMTERDKDKLLQMARMFAEDARAEKNET